MRGRQILSYLGYAILLFGVLTVSQLYTDGISMYVLFVFGFLIGLENLINQFQHDGIWKINLTKLVFLGIPAFIVYLTNPLYLNINQLVGTETANLLKPLSPFGIIILGYVLATIFYKSNDNIRVIRKYY